MRKIYAFLLRLFGWKHSITVSIPDKCILCVAPHTSNWDFVVGMIFYKSIGGEPHFLMKKTWFFFPLSIILKSMGGISVNRQKKSFLSDQMVKLFDNRKHFQLAVAPEGTRKKNEHWKTGFYYIALNANVPITLVYIDYSKKEIGTHRIFHPTGQMEPDIDEIKQYYKDVKGKHPKKFTI